MPRKSQNHIKKVDIIDRIEVSGEDMPGDFVVRKTRMWVKAWIADTIRPMPHSRVTFSSQIFYDENGGKIHCAIQVFSHLGFFSAASLASDLRAAVKNCLKELSLRSRARVGGVDQVPLPQGFVVSQGSQRNVS